MINNALRYHEELHGMKAGAALYEGQQEWVKYEDYVAVCAERDALKARIIEMEANTQAAMAGLEAALARAEKAEADCAMFARKNAALRLWLEYDSTDDDDGVTMMLRYEAALEATRLALQEKPAGKDSDD